jgi:L-lactate utilization protein LutB
MDSQLVEKAVKALRERDIQVYLAEGRAAAIEKIGEIIKSGPVALSAGEYIAGLGIDSILRAGNIDFFIAGEDRSAREGQDGGEYQSASVRNRKGSLARILEQSAWGITGAAVIAADTGSILIIEDRGNDHVVSALPPAHMVVADTGSIVPTMGEALAVCREISRQALNKPLARHISIISGPSMTADIQGVLVKGMHGPLEVHVVLVREEQEEPDPRQS